MKRNEQRTLNECVKGSINFNLKVNDYMQIAMHGLAIELNPYVPLYVFM